MHNSIYVCAYIIIILIIKSFWGRHGHERDCMVVGFTTTYAISDLRQVCCFLWVLPIKLTATI